MRRAMPQLPKPLFRDRRDAGRRLAAALERFRDERPVVIGLPRGGVPVAYEVARALETPLDVVVVRKLGAPLQPEYAIGAIAENGVALVDDRAVEVLGITVEELRQIADREARELERRVQLFRDERGPVDVRGRTVLLVDDGLATGSSAVAATQTLRRRGADRVVLAVPVAPPGSEDRIAAVDEVVSLHEPPGFFAVGPYYEEFAPIADEEVRRLLRAAADGRHVAATSPRGQRRNGGLDWSRVEPRSVTIPAGRVSLPGDLRSPPEPSGLVIFAHGSGSSRRSPRNVQVATALGSHGFATLLFDLLDERESASRHNVFDINLLTGRLIAATDWALREPELLPLPLGYFGASTGAAAALSAAAALGDGVRAVVSRGGRPDLAERRLSEVSAPTLLIVGGDDWNVLALNEDAATVMRCHHELAVVPHAGHLFEEPGALERVTELAADWFTTYLGQAAGRDAA